MNLNFAFASCVCLRIHYITVLFPFDCCTCLRIGFISFRPEPFETNMMVEVRRLLRCPGCMLARLSRAFAKCRFKRIFFFRTTKRIDAAISAFIFNHRIHCTTLSWLQTICVEVFSLLSITTKFIRVNMCALSQGRFYNSQPRQSSMLAVYIQQSMCISLFKQLHVSCLKQK